MWWHFGSTRLCVEVHLLYHLRDLLNQYLCFFSDWFSHSATQRRVEPFFWPSFWGVGCKVSEGVSLRHQRSSRRWDNDRCKKRGDNIGRSGHKHLTGDKIVALCDRNCNVVAPFVTAPGNANETKLFPDAFNKLKDIAKAVGMDIIGSVISLDGAYDSKKNRKMIFNAGMVPNINENKRNRKSKKRGRKRLFDKAIFKERFRTIERVFSWEDKFKRLLLRFEYHSIHHYAMKLMAYTMINLRHFCKPP